MYIHQQNTSILKARQAKLHCCKVILHRVKPCQICICA